MFLLNKINIKTKGWILVVATFGGFMLNIILVLFALSGLESREAKIEQILEQNAKIAQERTIQSNSTELQNAKQEYKDFFALSETLLVGGSLVGLFFYIFYICYGKKYNRFCRFTL